MRNRRRKWGKHESSLRSRVEKRVDSGRNFNVNIPFTFQVLGLIVCALKR